MCRAQSQPSHSISLSPLWLPPHAEHATPSSPSSVPFHASPLAACAGAMLRLLRNFPAAAAGVSCPGTVASLPVAGAAAAAATAELSAHFKPSAAHSMAASRPPEGPAARHASTAVACASAPSPVPAAAAAVPAAAGSSAPFDSSASLLLNSSFAAEVCGKAWATEVTQCRSSSQKDRVGKVRALHISYLALLNRWY
jgi:hypothetical protein